MNVYEEKSQILKFLRYSMYYSLFEKIEYYSQIFNKRQRHFFFCQIAEDVC